MKELVIISGKGGTGKTSIVSAFAALAENKVLCDADVDAADLHLIMAPGAPRFQRRQQGIYQPREVYRMRPVPRAVPVGCYQR